MAHVESIINRRHLADTAEARHALVLDVIGGLLSDELVLVGDVVGGDPAYIDPWPGTTADILDRNRSIYAEQYDHSRDWVFRIWFSLNDDRRLWSHQARVDVLSAERDDTGPQEPSAVQLALTTPAASRH